MARPTIELLRQIPGEHGQGLGRYRRREPEQHLRRLVDQAHSAHGIENHDPRAQALYDLFVKPFELCDIGPAPRCQSLAGAEPRGERVA